ncbi:MAG TPA: hypothetical protein VGK16_08675 [Candidatus Limnocylindrales bacterium]|jgi:hypothetical protein
MIAAVVLILASWGVLVLLGIARLLGRRPTALQWVRWIARIAIVGAIIGGGLATWAMTSFMDGMAHFDSGIPPEHRALLDSAFWGVIVVGAVLGLLAASRVREPSARRSR